MTTTDLARRDEVMKTLWKRPEGVFGIITGIGLFGAIGYGLYKILPFLVAMASNLIWLIVEIAVLVVLVYILFNRDTWRNLSLIWYQINRKILGWIVDLDPISVLRRAIGEMKESMDTINQKVKELGAINVSMEEKLKEYKKEYENNILLKKRLEEKLKNTDNMTDKDKYRYMGELRNVNNSLVRSKEQIEKQIQRLKTSTKYYEIMDRLAMRVELKVRDAEDDLRHKEDDFNQAKKSHSALKGIMGILKGGMSETLEQEMALDSINNTVNLSIAEMRELIDGSNDILTKFELEDGINSEKADELLALYETNGFSIFDEGSETSPGVSANIFGSKPLKGETVKPALEDGHVHEAELVEVEREAQPAPKKSKYFN